MFVIAKAPEGPFLCGKPDDSGVLHPSWVSYADSASIFRDEDEALQLADALSVSEGTLGVLTFKSLKGSCFRSGMTPNERRVQTQEFEMDIGDRKVLLTITAELMP